MNRRHFFKALGVGAAAVAITPELLVNSELTLPVGVSGQVLQVIGGIPKWVEISAFDLHQSDFYTKLIRRVPKYNTLEYLKALDAGT